MSDSSSNSGDSVRTSASSASSLGSPRRKTKFERDVEAAQRKGASECKNLLHWEVKRIADPTGGNTWTDAGIKSDRDILRLMSPGPAKCSCEKKACRWAWTGNWNYKGMFQTQYVAPGMEQKGIGNVAPGFPAKKIWTLNYSMPQESMDFLMKRFPEWYFIQCYGSSHDHPVAHTSTKIASERLLDKLPRGTVGNEKVYIDLNGNPMSNAAYMRRNPGIGIITFVECITPKDFIRRATKWGPQYIGGVKQWYDEVHIRDLPSVLGADIGGSIAGFISVHTSYYYDAQEISDLLRWAPNAVYYASMHRFQGMHGKLNKGEQIWTKNPGNFGARVSQSNVSTGETYEHPDNSWWFDHDSRVCSGGAFGWTQGALCDETYYFMAVSVPIVQAQMSSSCFNVAPFLPTTKHSTCTAMTAADISANRRVDLKLGGLCISMPILPEHVELFMDLRMHAMGRARTAKEYKDFRSYARIRAKSLMSDNKIPVDVQQLYDMSTYAFFIDFEDQYGADKSMFGAGFTTTIFADELYKNGSGMLSTGGLSLLVDMLTSAVDAKDWKMAGVKAGKAAVSHLNRKNLLNTL